jgi:hypothetical protein
VNCAKCANPVHPLEVFPGDLCFPCWEPQGERMVAQMTATDLAAMWGGKVQRVQGLRRSNAAAPHRNRKRYHRPTAKKEGE